MTYVPDWICRNPASGGVVVFQEAGEGGTEEKQWGVGHSAQETAPE